MFVKKYLFEYAHGPGGLMLIKLPYLIIHTTEPRPAALIFPPSDHVLPTKTSELLMVVLCSTVKRQLIADENCYVCRTSKR